ncbi:MAG: AAA family ATPase [Myxococcales bacterium]|nr:MAG: AAA family ATPase [Myxococcales bacterium]
MKPRTELARQLHALGLVRTAEDLDDFLARATKGRFSPLVVLEELARQEIAEREQRSLERRRRAAKLGRFKPIDEFDWNWPQKIDRALVDRALCGELVDQHENLILVAAQGLGKTMLARNIAHQAVLQGHSALFVEASRMLLDLGVQDSARSLERRLRHYAKPALLCIDEVGYLSYDARAADLLFEVVSRRYEQKSIVITTNLAFKDWPTIFPNASCVTALIDRLTHHADIALIEGQSYRRREAEARRPKKTPQ